MCRLSSWGPSEWAERVAEELAERLRRQPRLRLCLPTGDTPSPVYERLAELSRTGRAPLAQATILLLDEYVGLPPTDPARCDNRLRRELLERLAGGSPTFQPIAVDELAPQGAAEAHDALAAEGLDLALVGLGLNGHVGFNEPGSTPESPTRVVELTPESRASAVERYAAGSAPGQGITLGLKRLLESSEIWLLASGEHKASVLRRALLEPESSDCPASFLRRHPRLRVLADEPAAGGL